MKGSEATYRNLISALLGINKMEDAEGVCQLLLKSSQPVQKQTPVKDAVVAAVSGRPDVSSPAVSVSNVLGHPDASGSRVSGCPSVSGLFNACCQLLVRIDPLVEALKLFSYIEGLSE